MSPAFIYNQLNDDCQGGLHIPDALNLVQEDGILPLSLVPYNEFGCDALPRNQEELANQYRIDNWGRANPQSPTDLKSFLVDGRPVVLGIRVYQEFDNLGAGVMVQATGEVRGQHAVLLVAYDDNRNRGSGAFRIFNSWGTSWGDRGMGWVSYDALRDIVDEAYVSFDHSCTQEPTGSVDEPSTGDSVPARFVASGSVRDRDGLSGVTITVDDLDRTECKLREVVRNEPTGAYDFEIEVDLEECGVAQGAHTLGLWAKDNCGNGVKVDDVEISYRACEPRREACDGRDNDCDGEVDNGASCANGRQCRAGACVVVECDSGDVRPCPDGTDVGVCRAGTETCDDNQWGPCVGQVGPAVESCDGRDEDCDGTADNSARCANGGACENGRCIARVCSDGENRACPGGTDTGECNAGTQTCIDNDWGNCVGQVGARQELCNGRDDDCDGSIDDRAICDNGLECQNGRCIVVVCQDNDVRPCPGGVDQGECSAGSQTCLDNAWGDCAGQVGPAVEVCDGRDNDCDGQLDGNDGDLVQCRQGEVCQAGRCQPDANPPDPCGSVGIQWQRVSDLPGEVDREVLAAAVGDEIHLLYGGNRFSPHFVYDIGRDSWNTLNEVGAGQSADQASVASVNGRLYILGAGGAWNPGAAVRWESANDSWTTLAVNPNPISTSRSAVIGDRVYVTTGFFPDDALVSYDVSEDQWRTHSQLVPPADRGALVTYDGKLYLFGADGGAGQALARSYDPSLDQWTLLADPRAGVGQATAVAYRGLIFVLGGGPSDSVWVYVPAENRWCFDSLRMPFPSYGHATVSTGDGFYLLGGMRARDGAPSREVWRGTFSE